MITQYYECPDCRALEEIEVEIPVPSEILCACGAMMVEVEEPITDIDNRHLELAVKLLQDLRIELETHQNDMAVDVKFYEIPEDE